MRLINAPIGIFRFDGELVLKTEYYSKDKQSGKYIPDCYIVRTGEYFWGSAKTANELINLDIEPVDFAELLPTVTDTISRKQAVDALRKMQTYKLFSGDDMLLIDQAGAMTELMLLPSAQLDTYWKEQCQSYEQTINKLRESLSTQPEIVGCKDCKYWHSGSCEYPEHAVNSQDYYVGDMETEAEHFCGYAERREVTT